MATLIITPLFQDFATDNAAHWVGVIWSGPLIASADDRTLLNERVEMAFGINKFTL